MTMHNATLPALLVLLIVTSCTDVMEGHYSTRKAAEQARLFDQGWLPSFIPSSAVDIYEAHDLDSNHGLIRFSLQPEALEEFSANLDFQVNPTPLPEVSLRLKRPWWPMVFRGRVFPGELEKLRYQTAVINHITGSSATTYGCAVSPQEGFIYLWY
jgi:hypothetical protein